ncbi:Hypothetical predicted protein, partial [Paramuricea clavata]
DNNNTKAHHPTYAEKTANPTVTKTNHQYPIKNNLSKESEHTSQSVVSEAGQSSDDFIGVQGKRVPKLDELRILTSAQSFDLGFITETWLRESVCDTHATLFDYHLVRRDRSL